MNTSYIFGSYQTSVINNNSIFDIAGVECYKNVDQHDRYHSVIKTVIKNVVDIVVRFEALHHHCDYETHYQK